MGHTDLDVEVHGVEVHDDSNEDFKSDGMSVRADALYESILRGECCLKPERCVTR